MTASGAKGEDRAAPKERPQFGMIGRFLTLSNRTVQSGFKVTPVCGA